MAQQLDRSMNLTMDAASVYREDVYTDRKVGTIRSLTPVKSDGSPDAAAKAPTCVPAILYRSIKTCP